MLNFLLKNALLRRLAQAILRPSLRRKLYQARDPLRYGALTDYLVATYCIGQGIEVGPGFRPYAPATAVLVDKFISHSNQPIPLDVQADAARLPFRESTLDYLVSAHVLEHHPDVLAMLNEWQRVLRDGGVLLLMLPHAERTWDRGRPLADYDHHVAELGSPFDADNPDHWDDFESISLMQGIHYWASETGARTPVGEWNRRWIAERGLIHYHAWTQHEMVQILVSAGMTILTVLERMPDRGDTFLVVARK